MAYHYVGLGILLACLSGCCLLAFFLNLILNEYRRQTPLYLRRLPKKEYPEEFLNAINRAYETTGTIRGMLVLLQEKWKKGPAGKRIPAALDYLEHSRYRDYETALFYLSDQSTACEATLQKVLEKEVRKQKGLICKIEYRDLK